MNVRFIPTFKKDEHNWRIRVVDNAAGNEGAITEFRNGKNIISNFHFRNDFLFR
jgi:hypothetical protein